MDHPLLVVRILYVLMWLAVLVLLVAFISTLLSFFIIDVTEYTITSKKYLPYLTDIKFFSYLICIISHMEKIIKNY